MAEPSTTTYEPSHAGVLIAVAKPRSAPLATVVRTLICVVVTGGALTGGAAADEEAGGVEVAVAVGVGGAREEGFKIVNPPSTPISAISATPATSHGAFEGRRRTSVAAGAIRVACRVGGAAAGTGLVPPSAARAASVSSVTLPKRSPGFLAMPRAITASNAAGNPGRSALGRGGGWCRCAPISDAAVDAANGLLPVRHWCSTQASE